MLDPATAAAADCRLRTLLDESVGGVGEDAIAEARSLGAERAGEVVAWLVRTELTSPTASGGAIRAAHLAAELRLTRAVPALVVAVERLPESHPLRHAACSALTRLGELVVDALLAAFHGAAGEERARLAEVIARVGADDERVSAALVRVLEDDPARGARYLAERGEWRALADLSRAVDRVTREPECECGICASDQLRALATAIRVLGGALTDAQVAAFDAVLERAAAQWIPFDEPRTLAEAARAIAARPVRPARNAPCHCGSGKKYKKCHLAADELSERH